MQTPPMFSAKKFGGVKLYELARKNIIVDREPAQINIMILVLLISMKLILFLLYHAPRNLY